jgi:predicted small metal-binding protein
MKTINCREAGFDCDLIVKGETEEVVLKNGMEHAKKDHNMKEEDMTPELKEKIRSIIRSS